jgi:hypothetical protein
MIEASFDGEVGFWTYDLVEARLVEAVRCWWRMPGGGKWPFAGDAPWHLIRPVVGDYDVGLDKHGKPVKLTTREDAPKPRPAPLTRAEIADMEEATEWLTFVGEDKRRVLVLALVERAKGKKQVGWSAMRETLGQPELTGAGLEYRYSRAVTFIANVLNAASGVPYASRKGARARWPADVSEAAARLKSRISGAEGRQGRR